MEKELEKDIQRTICDYLSKYQYFFWRSNNVPVFGRSNDGQKRFRALPKYTPRGLPDIILIHNGRFIGFEVKRPGAKLRPEQAEFGANVAVNGGLYYVVHSLEEVTNALVECGAYPHSRPDDKAYERARATRSLAA